MFRAFTVALCLGLILVLAACTPAPPPPAPDTREADAKALRDIEAAWSKAAAAKDADAFAGNYAETARLAMPNVPLLTGKEAIRAALKEAMADKAFKLEFQTTNVTVARGGDLATTEGTYTSTATSKAAKKPMTEKGNYLTAWQKQADGSWKVIFDMSVQEAPPKPAGK